MTTYRHQCPLCQTLVETHAPGLSYVERDGIRYHPKCWEEETGEGVTNLIHAKNLRGLDQWPQ